ncbi:hypothetical protein ENUP19_0127G0003 [Entamoeba nuttalli]|uniref:Uncharacterized protein n=1 Tax=Entamoeba nuttalli TaxID=412467 RepID=A0ABQ0DJK1_9EUKA
MKCLNFRCDILNCSSCPILPYTYNGYNTGYYLNSDNFCKQCLEHFLIALFVHQFICQEYSTMIYCLTYSPTYEKCSSYVFDCYSFSATPTLINYSTLSDYKCCSNYLISIECNSNNYLE